MACFGHRGPMLWPVSVIGDQCHGLFRSSGTNGLFLSSGTNAMACFLRFRMQGSRTQGCGLASGFSIEGSGLWVGFRV